MPECEAIHAEFDGAANGDVQLGELPGWTHVTGPVAYYVFAGPYSELPRAWAMFMEKAMRAAGSWLVGPPGDIYACPPEAHPGPKAASMITILWAPVRP